MRITSILPALLLSVLGLVCLPTDAGADEIFEFEGGVVVRGYVMREEGERLTIRLTGFANASTVTVERKRLVRRRPVGLPTTSTQPLPKSVYSPRDADPEVAYVPDTPRSVDEVVGDPVPDFDAPDDVDEVPTIRDESFLDRFVRLARVALPDSVHARVTVAFLLLTVLVLLIGAGARLADMDGASFPTAVFLAGLFAGALIANLYAYEDLLRADRALWVLPLQTLTWITAARMTIGGSIGRAVLLFAFTLVSLMTVVFVTGAVFMAV